jgi:cytochrome b561
MVSVPVTGWLASSFFGSSTNVFGLFVIPPLVPKSELGVTIFYWAHFGLVWSFLTLIAFHAGAAMYHHFIRKDRTLAAMLPWQRGGSA